MTGKGDIVYAIEVLKGAVQCVEEGNVILCGSNHFIKWVDNIDVRIAGEKALNSLPLMIDARVPVRRAIALQYLFVLFCHVDAFNDCSIAALSG